MLAELSVACGLLGDALAGLELPLLSGTQCARVVETLAGVEKRCAAVRALAAARAAGCDAHKERGYPTAAAWLAHQSGISTGEARSVLATGAALEGCPATKEAVLAGEVSLTQAGEITKTETVVSGSERALLDLASTTGMAGLRDAARKVRLEAQDADEAHGRQHAERYLRHWRDEHGMIRIAGAFSPDVGVPMINRIDTATDRLYRQSDNQAEDQRQQLAADALVQLILDGGSSPKARSAELVLVCDIAAYRRGHRHHGEACHVIGGGPVPVTVARDLAVDAFIKAVLHDGIDITTVVHYGRHIKAELRTALGLGLPPDFDGAVCADDGCDRRYGLQWDHVDPYIHGGPTSFENLQPRCRPHHREKTERDRAAGLLRPAPPRLPCDSGDADHEHCELDKPEMEPVSDSHDGAGASCEAADPLGHAGSGSGSGSDRSCAPHRPDVGDAPEGPKHPVP
jgi:hypothetical protein